MNGARFRGRRLAATALIGAVLWALAVPLPPPAAAQSQGLAWIAEQQQRYLSAAVPNGCRFGDTGLFDWVPDGKIALFETACNRHDLCYARRQISLGSCDGLFDRDLAAACASLVPDLYEGSNPVRFVANMVRRARATAKEEIPCLAVGSAMITALRELRRASVQISSANMIGALDPTGLAGQMVRCPVGTFTARLPLGSGGVVSLPAEVAGDCSATTSVGLVIETAYRPPPSVTIRCRGETSSMPWCQTSGLALGSARYGVPVAAEIDRASGADYFRYHQHLFTGKRGDFIVVRLDVVSADYSAVRPSIALLRPDGGLVGIATPEAGPANRRVELGPVILPVTGRYAVLVGNEGTSAFRYRLTIGYPAAASIALIAPFETGGTDCLYEPPTAGSPVLGQGQGGIAVGAPGGTWTCGDVAAALNRVAHWGITESPVGDARPFSCSQEWLVEQGFLSDRAALEHIVYATDGDGDGILSLPVAFEACPGADEPPFGSLVAAAEAVAAVPGSVSQLGSSLWDSIGSLFGGWIPDYRPAVGGQDTLTVPDLSRLLRRDAEAVLRAAGFSECTTTVCRGDQWVYAGLTGADDPAEVGKVADQYPKPGTAVAVTLKVPGVRFWLGTQLVPDVLGLSPSEAAAEIQRWNLRPSPIGTEATSDPALDGKVVRQSPPAGEMVSSGTRISYWIGEAGSTGTSSGTTSGTSAPGPIVLKNYLGWSCSAARADLQALGLVAPPCEFSWYVPYDSPLAGTVDSQEPGVGTTLARGSTVLLWALEAATTEAECDLCDGYWHCGCPAPPWPPDFGCECVNPYCHSSPPPPPPSP